jgi:hypothetical protein
MKELTVVFSILAGFAMISCTSNTNQNIPKLVDTGSKIETHGKFSPNAGEKDFNILNKDNEPFKNEELPQSYLQRTFIKKLAASTYDIFLVPGYIVKFNPVTNEYEKKTLTPVIRKNKVLVSEVIQDGTIYSSKINKGASFNGSFVIGGLSVSNKQIMELLVQDVTKSSVPDSLIDAVSIKNIVDNQIPADQRQYYFYVKNAVLTLINYRVFRESKIDTKVNTTYVTVEGKVYNSNEKFSRERVVSVELVSLNEIITAPIALK